MYKEIITPLLTSFLVGLVTGPVVISFLNKEKANQTEREELASHQKKAGTPTMGGIIILCALLVASAMALPSHPDILPVLILTIGFGLIGFLDDFLKVILRRSDGLLAWQKLLLQIAVTSGFLFYVIKISNIGLWMKVPFLPGSALDIGWLAIPLLYFAVIGTVNGTNFTDGVDGLATTVTIIVAGFFVFASISVSQTLKDPAGVTPAAAAMAGALLAFLVFNCYPARIFMGDTGSLALGGFVSGMAYMLHMPLFILIIGFIYLIEVISVILQVGYFKMTGGKRIFRMAPIHHHFELGGWSETRVVTVFSIITLLLCVIAYAGL